VRSGHLASSGVFGIGQLNNETRRTVAEDRRLPHCSAMHSEAHRPRRGYSRPVVRLRVRLVIRILRDGVSRFRVRRRVIAVAIGAACVLVAGGIFVSRGLASASAATCARAWNSPDSPGLFIAKSTLAVAGPRLLERASSVQMWVGVTRDPFNGNRIQCSVKFVFPGGAVAESDGVRADSGLWSWSQQSGPYLFGKPTFPPTLNASLTGAGRLILRP
jgi:hypothetical protein